MADRVTPLLDAKKDLSNLFDLTGQVAFVPGGIGGSGRSDLLGPCTGRRGGGCCRTRTGQG